MRYGGGSPTDKEAEGLAESEETSQEALLSDPMPDIIVQ